MTTALLLAGGLATRLGSLSQSTPKACVPVCGLTPLAFLLPKLHEAGVTQVWMNVHHHSEQVQDEAIQHAPPGLQLHFLEETSLLGTGGTLLEVTRLAGELPQLVLNAKIFTDFDFAPFLQTTGANLVLHASSSLEVFGGFLHSNGLIQRLRPSGPPAQESAAAVYTGICRPSSIWLEALAKKRHESPNEMLCLVRHAVLPTLGEHQVRATLHHGKWCEISTLQRIQEAESVVLALSSKESAH